MVYEDGWIEVSSVLCNQYKEKGSFAQLCKLTQFIDHAYNC